MTKDEFIQKELAKRNVELKKLATEAKKKWKEFQRSVRFVTNIASTLHCDHVSHPGKKYFHESLIDCPVIEELNRHIQEIENYLKEEG